MKPAKQRKPQEDAGYISNICVITYLPCVPSRPGVCHYALITAFLETDVCPLGNALCWRFTKEETETFWGRVSPKIRRSDSTEFSPSCCKNESQTCWNPKKRNSEVIHLWFTGPSSRVTAPTAFYSDVTQSSLWLGRAKTLRLLLRSQSGGAPGKSLTSEIARTTQREPSPPPAECGEIEQRHG